jgi:DNA modification methylase
MKPYYEQDDVTIYPDIADASIDFVFTDPPTGNRRQAARAVGTAAQPRSRA